MKALRAIAAAALALAAAPAGAADWTPRKPVTLVVPYNVGGGTDATARAVARQLTVLWGQPVVVENLSGADGLIGTRKVIDAEPDGHTLLVQVPTIVAMKHQRSLKGIDPLARLAPITSIATSPALILAGARQPFTTLAGLARYCREAQQPCSVATLETSSRLRARQFAADHQLPALTIVNYRGAAAIVNDLVAGHITMAFTGITAALPLHRSGQLRILASAGTKRPASLPDVPTSDEAGWPNAHSSVWYGVFAPGGTPVRIQQAIAQAIRRTRDAPDVLKAISATGAEPEMNSPEEFAADIRREDARLTALVKRFPID